MAMTERGLLPGPEEQRRRRFMIAGEKTILRALEPHDLERCFRWMNDPSIVRTLESRYPMPFQIVILSIFADRPRVEGVTT